MGDVRDGDRQAPRSAKTCFPTAPLSLQGGHPPPPPVAVPAHLVCPPPTPFRCQLKHSWREGHLVPPLPSCDAASVLDLAQKRKRELRSLGLRVGGTW